MSLFTDYFDFVPEPFGFVFKVILILGALAIAGIASFIAYHLYWVGRSRRPIELGFEYVYVNQDGSVRELDEDDQSYLSQDFAPGDGGRPYIKSHYEAVDGWGSLSGFIRRRRVPAELEISPMNQNDLPISLTLDDLRQIHRQAGGVIIENADGSFKASRV